MLYTECMLSSAYMLSIYNPPWGDLQGLRPSRRGDLIVRSPLSAVSAHYDLGDLLRGATSFSDGLPPTALTAAPICCERWALALAWRGGVMQADAADTLERFATMIGCVVQMGEGLIDVSVLAFLGDGCQTSCVI
jgi:hypothetical protein